MESQIAFRILAVIATTILAAFGLFAVILHLLYHYIAHSGYRPHTYELGQLIGFAAHDSVTPRGTYRPSLGFLPDWLAYLVGRCLHLELWICAVALLPLLVLLASLALDWAIGRDAIAADDYL